MIRPEGRSRRGPQMSATPDSTLANPEQRIADLERQLAEREAKLAEALQRETATGEVLQVINSSPGDLAPVFDAMLEKATRLCEAVFGTLSIWDGERFHWVAFRGLPTELVEALQQLAMIPVGDRRPVADRIVRGEVVISMPDLREAEHRGVPVAQAFLRHGARSCVTVALRKEERLLGLITIYREEVRPFSDKQIAIAEFRGAGGHCDGERAAPDRNARSTGAADRDRRSVAGYQLLTRRPRAGVRGDAGKGYLFLPSGGGDTDQSERRRVRGCGGAVEPPRNVRQCRQEVCDRSRDGGRSSHARRPHRPHPRCECRPRLPQSSNG